MAHNEYYTFDQGSVNGKVSMNIRVFDEIVKKTFEYPIVDVLRKPFNERDIRKVVEKTIKL